MFKRPDLLQAQENVSKMFKRLAKGDSPEPMTWEASGVVFKSGINKMQKEISFYIS